MLAGVGSPYFAVAECGGLLSLELYFFGYRDLPIAIYLFPTLILTLPLFAHSRFLFLPSSLSLALSPISSLSLLRNLLFFCVSNPVLAPFAPLLPHILVWMH